jgi:hypothetical protein
MIQISRRITIQAAIYILIHLQADATSQYRSCIKISKCISIQARICITEAYPFARQHNLQSV